MDSTCSADDANSASLALPFADAMTPMILEELNLFEDDTKNLYKDAFETKGKGNHITSHKDKPLNLYTWNDVAIESVLGEGAFSVVFQVSMKKKQKEDELDTRGGMTVTSRTTTVHALKCLKAKSVETEDDLLYNAMDLMTEAHILMHTNHPHIISMTGMSDYRLGDSYGLSDGFFLVLEIMETTLLDTLNEWRKEIQYSKMKRKQLLSSDTMKKRLVDIALPMTNAVIYLHQHDICLRDLKPENVGFDSRGTLKLFDFGLARLRKQMEEGEMAGSVCYMAPEVLLETGTSRRSDVYSLAMIIWELVTLELPMGNFHTIEQIQKKVAKGHWRPSLSMIPIRSLRNTISMGWTHSANRRSTAKEMEYQLHQICGSSGPGGYEVDISYRDSDGASVRSLSTTDTKEKTTSSGGGRGSSFSSFFQKKRR